MRCIGVALLDRVAEKELLMVLSPIPSNLPPSLPPPSLHPPLSSSLSPSLALLTSFHQTSGEHEYFVVKGAHEALEQNHTHFLLVQSDQTEVNHELQYVKERGGMKRDEEG